MLFLLKTNYSCSWLKSSSGRGLDVVEGSDRVLHHILFVIKHIWLQDDNSQRHIPRL